MSYLAVAYATRSRQSSQYIAVCTEYEVSVFNHSEYIKGPRVPKISNGSRDLSNAPLGVNFSSAGKYSICIGLRNLEHSFIRYSVIEGVPHFIKFRSRDLTPTTSGDNLLCDSKYLLCSNEISNV